MKKRIKLVVTICFVLSLYLCLFTDTSFAINALLIAVPITVYLLVPEDSFWSSLSYDSNTKNVSEMKSKLRTLYSSDSELNKYVDKAMRMVEQYANLEKSLEEISISCSSRFANDQYIQIMKDSKEAFNISMNKFYSRMDIVIAHKRYNKDDLVFFSQELVLADSQLDRIANFLKEIVNGNREKEYVIVDDYTTSLKNLNNKY